MHGSRGGLGVWNPPPHLEIKIQFTMLNHQKYASYPHTPMARTIIPWTHLLGKIFWICTCVDVNVHEISKALSVRSSFYGKFMQKIFQFLLNLFISRNYLLHLSFMIITCLINCHLIHTNKIHSHAHPAVQLMFLSYLTFSEISK